MTVDDEVLQQVVTRDRVVKCWRVVALTPCEQMLWQVTAPGAWTKSPDPAPPERTRTSLSPIQVNLIKLWVQQLAPILKQNEIT